MWQESVRCMSSSAGASDAQLQPAGCVAPQAHFAKRAHTANGESSQRRLLTDDDFRYTLGLAGTFMARHVAALEALFVVVLGAVPAAAQVDQARAEQYFNEARALCERDGGRLWGVSLCGPMVIADAATGTLATSQPPPSAD